MSNGPNVGKDYVRFCYKILHCVMPEDYKALQYTYRSITISNNF
jgi:hypothetical protein